MGELADSGEFGEFGEAGEFGELGLSGELGLFGEFGDAGDFGEFGEAGDFGDAGDLGESGLTGEAIDAGDFGEIGDFGLTGDFGEMGLCVDMALATEAMDAAVTVVITEVFWVAVGETTVELTEGAVTVSVCVPSTAGVGSARFASARATPPPMATTPIDPMTAHVVRLIFISSPLGPGRRGDLGTALLDTSTSPRLDETPRRGR